MAEEVAFAKIEGIIDMESLIRGAALEAMNGVEMKVL